MSENRTRGQGKASFLLCVWELTIKSREGASLGPQQGTGTSCAQGRKVSLTTKQSPPKCKVKRPFQM